MSQRDVSATFPSTGQPVTRIAALHAAALPPLKCNVTKLSDNSIRYQILEEPRFRDCPTFWEDENKYGRDQEATCEVNCTLLMVEDSAPLEGFQILDAANLECNITKLDHASTLYQIFTKPNCYEDYSSWEKKNSTVIVAGNSNYSESFVKSLQNDSVELYVCEDFLVYNLECYEKDGKTYSKLTATCEVNCTCLMAKDSPQVDNGFPTWGIFVITLGIIFFILGIFILGIFWKKNNHSCRTNRPSSQSLTPSEAGAIMDNLINEQVSTDASPFLLVIRGK